MRFRVIWMRQIGLNEIQAVTECSDADKNSWGFDLDEEPEASGSENNEGLIKLLLATK